MFVNRKAFLLVCTGFCHLAVPLWILSPQRMDVLGVTKMAFTSIEFHVFSMPCLCQLPQDCIMVAAITSLFLNSSCSAYSTCLGGT